VSLTYDLYWSFRSPYSYLLTPRLVALEREFDITGNIRPVYPLAVRTPEFFDTRDPLWTSYLLRDILREAQFLGMPLCWPRPAPVFMDRATGKYPAQQPHIHRLTRLGVAAAERGRGLAYLDEVGRLIWSGSTDSWHVGDHLDRAAERAGLDPVELSRAADGEADRLHVAIEENQRAQREAGHWGVPMLVLAGEPFFGQDRFDQFKWRLGQQGLTPRR
jgi:2-hydroxychromene-2-carboxylate isomerase